MSLKKRVLSLSLLSLFGMSFLEEFPEDKNRILVLQNCLPCHSATLVSRQNMKRQEWHKTLLWMEKKHNLKLDAKETREKILDYLSSYFGDAEKKNEDFPMGRRPVNPLPENESF